VTVIAPLCAGLGLIVVFALWENFPNVKYPLCPPAIFRSNNGREFTAPFILAFIVTMFYYGINIIYPTMINTFYVGPNTSRTEEMLLTLPNNLGLVFGAVLLMCFGNLFGHWKITLTVSWIGLSIFGGLLALVTPYNKGTMIAFAFLEQMFFGWAQYESIAFTQLGVKQVDLGISGGLSGVARFAGGSLAQAIYTTILTNEQTSRAARTVPAAAMALGLGPQEAQQLLAAISTGATDAIAEIPGIVS
jgi:Fungal trichothecene efflux pump (TRI12)